MNKLKKNNVVSFPPNVTEDEREIEAILFAASEPLDIDTIESKISKKINALKSLTNIQSSLIFFESSKRLQNTLKNMLSIFGNRKCVVSRELTKYYETFYRGDLKKISMESLKINLKGEITVIIDKPDEESSSEKIILENEKLKKIYKKLSYESYLQKR